MGCQYCDISMIYLYPYYCKTDTLSLKTSRKPQFLAKKKKTILWNTRSNSGIKIWITSMSSFRGWNGKSSSYFTDVAASYLFDRGSSCSALLISRGNRFLSFLSATVTMCSASCSISASPILSAYFMRYRNRGLCHCQLGHPKVDNDVYTYVILSRLAPVNGKHIFYLTPAICGRPNKIRKKSSSIWCWEPSTGTAHAYVLAPQTLSFDVLLIGSVMRDIDKGPEPLSYLYQRLKKSKNIWEVCVGRAILKRLPFWQIPRALCLCQRSILHWPVCQECRIKLSSDSWITSLTQSFGRRNGDDDRNS